MSVAQSSDARCSPLYTRASDDHETGASSYDLESGEQRAHKDTANHQSMGNKQAEEDKPDSFRNQDGPSEHQAVGYSQSDAHHSEQHEGEQKSEHTLSGNNMDGIKESEQRQEQQDNDNQDRQKNVAYKRSGFRNRISNFTWTWFAATMSTGGIGIVLSETPHQFRGLVTIGKIFFVLEIVMFITFTCAIGLRFIFEPRALARSLSDQTEGFFFGCFWLTQATILANTQRYAVPACGPWLIKALEVLLWYYVGASLLVAIFLFSTHFFHRDLKIDKVQPSWVLGIYPTMLAGTLTSLFAPDQPTGSALAMIFGGIAFQGLGFMVSFMLITIFLWRCFYAGLPQPQVRVGMFILVGMPGYTATALQGLAQAATKHFPQGYLGVETVPAADVLVVVSIAVGAFLWLLSFIFFSWTVVCVAYGVNQMRFDVTWWASIFPNVGWVVATSLLGQTLNSQGIQWVASAMTIILVIFWLFVAGSHLKNILQGRSPPA